MAMKGSRDIGRHDGKTLKDPLSGKKLCTACIILFSIVYLPTGIRISPTASGDKWVSHLPGE